MSLQPNVLRGRRRRRRRGRRDDPRTRLASPRGRRPPARLPGRPQRRPHVRARSRRRAPERLDLVAPRHRDDGRVRRARRRRDPAPRRPRAAALVPRVRREADPRPDRRRLRRGRAPSRRRRSGCPTRPTPRRTTSRIEAAGGIDLFLLASGASDGHIAFNQPAPPATPARQSSRCSARRPAATTWRRSRLRAARHGARARGDRRHRHDRGELAREVDHDRVRRAQAARLRADLLAADALRAGLARDDRRRVREPARSSPTGRLAAAEPCPPADRPSAPPNRTTAEGTQHHGSHQARVHRRRILPRRRDHGVLPRARRGVRRLRGRHPGRQPAERLQAVETHRRRRSPGRRASTSRSPRRRTAAPALTDADAVLASFRPGDFAARAAGRAHPAQARRDRPGDPGPGRVLHVPALDPHLRGHHPRPRRRGARTR